MNTIKLEIFMIIISLLLLGGLGLRARAETEIVNQADKIIELEKQVDFEAQEIVRLEELLKPLEYAQPLDQIRISSGVGIRVSPKGGSTEALHRGTDLAAKEGTPVYAALEGVVAEHFLVPGWYNGKYYRGHDIMGGMITIKHEKGLYSIYGHLSASYVKEGDQVEMGQLLGLVGSTGWSSGPHLHWEFVVDGFKYLNERR